MSRQVLLDSPALDAKIAALARDLAAMAEDPARAALVGIKTRGAVLARRIQSLLDADGLRLPYGALDINLYRDDLSQLASHPLIRGTEIPFDVEGCTILLVDDVLFTGRTVRSAIDAILDFGRPRAIRLGALVDRGWREYPIQADYAGVKIQTRREQAVQVRLRETDGCDEVLLVDREGD